MSNRPPQSDWRQIRETVLERDGEECKQCGKGKSESTSLHVHHEQPLWDGGDNDLANLTTLCQSCHVELHAEERRRGTLEDIKDVFLAAEAPVFRTKEIDERFGDYNSSRTYGKLGELVDRGFLEKGDRGVYYRSDLNPESMNLAGNTGVVVDGSYVEDGEYLGHEDKIKQCDECGRWVYSKRPSRKLKSHKRNSCSES